MLAFDRVALRRGGRLLFADLSFALGPGEALLVTGPNGSGKSSLIRLAAGLLAAEAGTVTRATAALADDNLALDRDLPLGRALGFWIVDPVAALDMVGLADFVPVRFLSSGQRKRATLARVMASGAPLWLLDEPLNALDKGAVRRLGDAMQRHRAGGGAILAASHTPLPGAWRELGLGQ